MKFSAFAIVFGFLGLTADRLKSFDRLYRKLDPESPPAQPDFPLITPRTMAA